MAEAHDTGYLSIGEVLGILLEDFPDVTISKIRFLESQGLISPERTASGYRKFYDTDVDLLRVILTEQRRNYLPLRVIKDRLENGEIDPTGDHLRPDENGDGATGDAGPETAETGPETGADEESVAPSDVPSTSVSKHPASQATPRNGGAQTAAPAGTEAEPASAPVTTDDDADRQEAPKTGESSTETVVQTGAPKPSKPRDALPGVLLDRAELCAMVGMSDRELDQLESFGIVASREGATPALYGDDAVAVAKPACEFLRAGVDARHLRSYRTSAEREVSLYEQLVTPRMRQRSPESRAEALDELRRLDDLGAQLRAALTHQSLRRHFES